MSLVSECNFIFNLSNPNLFYMLSIIEFSYSYLFECFNLIFKGIFGTIYGV